MYRDGFKLLERAPWLGQGGETWRLAYRSVQSAPYVGAVMHSGWLDILLGLGVSGFVVTACWAGLICWRLVQLRSSWLYPFIVLLVHFSVDLDGAYGLFWLMLLWSAELGFRPSGIVKRNANLAFVKSDGEGRAGEQTAMGVIETAKRIRQVRAISQGALRKQIGQFKRQSLPFLTPISFAGAAAGLFILSLLCLRLLFADQWVQAASRTDDPHKQVVLLSRAAAWNPWRGDIAAALADRQPSAEAAASLLQQALRYSPEAPQLYSRLAAAYAATGDARAVQLWSAALRLDPYNAALQTEALQSLSKLADFLAAQGEESLALQTAAAGSELFNRYEQMYADMERLYPRHNDRGFLVTLAAKELSAKLAGYALGQ